MNDPQRCVCQVYRDGKRRRCAATATAERNGNPVCDGHVEPAK